MAVWPWTLALAVGFAAIHLFAGRIRLDNRLSNRLLVSVSGGVSLAYVFVHILPELNEEAAAFGEAGTGVVPFLEHHAYLVALVGFGTYYGIERFVQRSSDQRDETVETAGTENSDGTSTGAFWLHVASFTLYNTIIGYFLVHRIETGPVSLAIFFIAFGLHFFITDAGFARHHRGAYYRRGRWVLAAAILGGWALGILFELREIAIAALFAFLAGGVVLNVVKEEVPEGTRSSFLAFALGAAGYTVLLLLL